MTSGANVTVVAILMALLSSVSTSQVPAGSYSQPPSDEIVARLPAELQLPARQYVRLTAERWKTLAKGTDEALRALVIRELSQKPGAEDVVLSALRRETSETILLTAIGQIAIYRHWDQHAGMNGFLRKMAAAHSSASVSLEALEALRFLEFRRLEALLSDRRTRGGDDDHRFWTTEERLALFRAGAMLPGFLREPPPHNRVYAGSSIRAVIIGDFGSREGSAPSVVADSISAHHVRRPFDLGLTVGDNFYPTGMESPDDPRWSKQWDPLYGRLAIKFYATLGNHDWIDPDSPAAEILFTKRSQSWHLPAPYYSYSAGPVDFFALDTSMLFSRQLDWLNKALARSTARWKVAYGHHPVYYASEHRQVDVELEKRLMPALPGNVDLYIAGHEHGLFDVGRRQGVEFALCGAGGAPISGGPLNAAVRFGRSVLGYCVLEADQKTLSLSFVEASSGLVGHRIEIRRNPK